jgi:hypothetical protein
MSCRNFPYFCLHSEGTEEDRQGARIPDGVDLQDSLARRPYLLDILEEQMSTSAN